MNDHDAGPSTQMVVELQMPFCAKVLVLFVLMVIVHTLKDPSVVNTPAGGNHSDTADSINDHQWTSNSVNYNPETAAVPTVDPSPDTSMGDINQIMPSVMGDHVIGDKTTRASTLEDFRGDNNDEDMTIKYAFSKAESVAEESFWRPADELPLETVSNYSDYQNTVNKTESGENSTTAWSRRHKETNPAGGYVWQQWLNSSVTDMSDIVLKKHSQSASKNLEKNGPISRRVTTGIGPHRTQIEHGDTAAETDVRSVPPAEPGGSGPAPRRSRQTSGSLPVPATNRRHIRAWQEGDAIIGALFPIHKAPLQKNAYARQCGPVWETYGIQRVETFIMTVERINSDPSILPNMKLGWDIRDSCWYSAIALENSIDFIKDAIASQSIYSSPELSNSSDTDTTSTTVSPPRTTRQTPTSSSTAGWRDSYDSLTCRSPKHMKPIIGLVGPGSSESTIQVQNLLQIFNIPQIGYSATSLDLSDKNHYRYFLRVVPPDNNQAQVLVDILLTFNWTYVSTVYSEGNYGLKGMSKFTELAKSKGICIAETGNVASTSEDGKPFDEVLEKLLVNPNASVVVCFCEGNTVHKLFKATRRRGMERRLLIIGSDGWGNRLDVVEGVEEAAAGSISIMLYSPPFKDFRPYYERLKPFRSPKNPWFQEFWEYKFDCSLDKNNMRAYAKMCTGNESLVGSEEDSKLGFVVNAVTALARGLHNMREAVCPGSQGLCPAMEPLNGSVYLGHLLKVRFNSYSGDPVHFNQEGDPPARYDILNYQPTNKVDINGSRTYEYVTIGHWASGNLSLNHPKIYWPPGPGGGKESGQVLTSVCSEPCRWNEAQKVKGVPCCWICTLCLENEILVDNNTECLPCNRGQMPNRNKTACEDIPVDFISWRNTQALVSVSLASLGVGVTLWVLVTFVRHHNTPVVKASTRELSYILLVGICLAFGSNYFIVAQPGKEMCYLTRILPGLSFSLMYGALVTRTNRIARILEGSKRIMTKKPKFMSATAQVVITGIIIGIESAVIAAMLIYEPADSVLDYPTPKRVRLICNTSTLGIVAPLGFDLVLIILCTIYAVKTRNLPENFNEAKFIGFTMYATCVIWLGFFPIYFAGDNKELTLCLSMSLSAAIALILLFLPKVYVIVWVPEKNTRGAFTTSRDVRCHIGSKSMNSGDSMDIKESSTYDCLLKADKGQVRPWRQKLLDEKHLRLMMQRSTYSEEDSPYINHGVLSNHCPPSGNKTLADRNSKDSYRSESTTVSGQSGQDKERAHTFDHNRDSNEAGALRKILERDQSNHKNHLQLRPGSPAEKGRYRIQNISQTIGPQDLLQLRTFCELGPVGRSGEIRKSLSSTCVSSSQHSSSVSCQTSDDLVDFLLPPLRRRHMSKSKNKLERSEAVDDPATGTTNNQKGPREVVKYFPHHDPEGQRMYHSGNHLEIPNVGPQRRLSHNSHILNFMLPPDLDRDDSLSSVGYEDLNQRRHSHNVTASSRSLASTSQSPRRCSQDSAPASPFLPSPYASFVSRSPSKLSPRFSQYNPEKTRDQHSRESSSSCSVVHSAQSSPMHLVPKAITPQRPSSKRDLNMSSNDTLQEQGWQRDSSDTPPPEDSFSSTALSITSSSSFTLPPFHGSSDSIPSQETFDEVEEEFESSQSFSCSDVNSYQHESNRNPPRTPDSEVPTDDVLEFQKGPQDDVLEFQKLPQDDGLEFQKVPQDDVLEFQKYLQGHGVRLILSSVQSSDL